MQISKKCIAFPEAASRVKTDLYVDDCLSGSHSTESAKQLQRDLDLLFKSGNFRLRKWASNDPKVLEDIPIEDRAIQDVFTLKSQNGTFTIMTYHTLNK